MYRNRQNSSRRGAALIITLVLLACLAMVAGTVLPQILRDRQESQMALVRTQSHQLLDDALRNAEAKRHNEPEFAGATFTLGPDSQPFPGTFQVATQVENDAFIAKVEYRNEQGTIIYVASRSAR